MQEIIGPENLRVRITRTEERLVAEQSARKTRDDQLFQALAELRQDMRDLQQSTAASLEKVEAEISELNRLLVSGGERLEALRESDIERKSDILTLKEQVTVIAGTTKTLKWVWPLIMTLLGIIMTLILSNIDLKIEGSQGEGGTKVQEVFGGRNE